jgi:hypothetical protein
MISRNEALQRLSETKAKLEELLRVHSGTSLSAMAKASRPVLVAGLKQATELGVIGKDDASRLTQMLESPDDCGTSHAVNKVSRALVDAGLDDDGGRTEQDEKLVRGIRKTLAEVDAAIGQAGGSRHRIPTKAWKEHSAGEAVESSHSVVSDSKCGI